MVIYIRPTAPTAGVCLKILLVLDYLYAMYFLRLMLCCFISVPVLSQSHPDSLRKHIVKLGAFPFSRSSPHLEYLHKAGDYILKQWTQYTPNTRAQWFEVKGERFKNIIASFGANTLPAIILGAVYECPDGTPGADNNASGIACLTELARLISKQKVLFPFRIELVAYGKSATSFTKKEMCGSLFHIQQLQQDSIPLLGAIVLHGLGFFTDLPRTQNYPMYHYRWMYGRRGNFLAMFQSPGTGLWPRLMKGLFKQYSPGLRIINFKPIVPFEGFNDGDYLHYVNAQIPALMLSNTRSFRNKYFFFETDTYETLDYFRMAKVTDLLYRSLMRYRP
jgi:hypothetical protein